MRTAALCLVLGSLFPVSLAGKARPKHPLAPAADTGYVSALATADHFLRSWQTGDIETGIMLLSDAARRQSSEDKLRAYFATVSSRGFELHGGVRLRNGRYAFPIVLFEVADDRRARRRSSEIVVVASGMNDWAIDKLP